MSGILNMALRGLGLVFTLIFTALIGNLIASNINGHMVTINFSMFVAALSWVAILFGLVAAVIAALALPIVLLSLDILAVLFTFIDAIVLAAETRAPNCSNLSHANLPHDWIGWGSANNEHRCRKLQAATAFVWFLWATLCVCLFFTFRQYRSGYAGSSRSSRPNMSQVGV
jgi:Zn-dependent membrane protease YugP